MMEKTRVLSREEQRNWIGETTTSTMKESTQWVLGYHCQQCGEYYEGDKSPKICGVCGSAKLVHSKAKMRTVWEVKSYPDGSGTVIDHELAYEEIQEVE